MYIQPQATTTVTDSLFVKSTASLNLSWVHAVGLAWWVSVFALFGEDWGFGPAWRASRRVRFHA